jgi:TorA maturation chaperone TorD
VNGRLSALLYSSCASVIAVTLARLLADPPDGELLHEVARLTVCAPHDRLATAVQRVAILAASADVEACRAEYHRLFVSPGGALILPWESTWTEIPPKLSGEPHADALRFYARAGFHPRNVHDPADHIATELTFVAVLAQRREKRLLAEFWSAHVLPWMPAFARRLQLETREPLYAAVAGLLLASATPIPSAQRQRELRVS